MLTRYGVKPGDRVGILLPNVPEYIPILHGIWMSGAIAVAVAPPTAAGEVFPFMKLSDCKVVTALHPLAPFISDAPYTPYHRFLQVLVEQARLPFRQARTGMCLGDRKSV